MAKLSSIVLLSVLIFTTGCASYRERVADDFRDTFKAKVGVGLGVYAQAKATSYLDAGLGWGGYWQNVGFESRHTDLVHPSIDGCPFPLALITGGTEGASVATLLRMASLRSTPRSGDEDEYAVAGQLFDAAAVAKWDAYGVDKRSRHDVFGHVSSYTEHPVGIEVGVGLVVVNARVGFDPVEFVDLLCTAFGCDLLRDNPPRDEEPSSRPSE